MTRATVVTRHGLAWFRWVTILPFSSHVVYKAPIITVTMTTARMTGGATIIPFAGVEIVVRIGPTPVVFCLVKGFRFISVTFF